MCDVTMKEKAFKKKHFTTTVVVYMHANEEEKKLGGCNAYSHDKENIKGKRLTS